MNDDDVVVASPAGLFCPAGAFHIDPHEPVDTALVTHAHADHARPGSAHYHVVADGADLVRRRLGADARVTTHEYAEPIRLGSVRVSFHPAGHMRGAAQVRIEHANQCWVVTGDFKRVADPTARSFETLACDGLVIEATFALPVFRWPRTSDVIDEIVAWQRQAAADGRAAVLFCYALGKAQRLLAELDGRLVQPVLLHGAVHEMTRLYRKAGVAMAPTERIDDPQGRVAPSAYAGRLVIAPPGAGSTPWMRRFGKAATGFCSGWMRIRGNRRRRGYERGFVLSDHADWPALLDTIEASGARSLRTHHGYADVLARFFAVRGLDARAIAMPGSDGD